MIYPKCIRAWNALYKEIEEDTHLVFSMYLSFNDSIQHYNSLL